MVGVEHILGMTALLFLIFLIMLIFLSSKRVKNVKPQRSYLKADMIKIKEQITQDEE